MAENVQQAVCVIIAARNAAETIGRAIASALSEAAVSEVVVVDDASTDATAEVALGADDGSGRLKIMAFKTNRGPSAARNHAIAESRSPLIAILDADDFFFPGRFEPMLAEDDWDLIADNIAFVQEAEESLRPERFKLRPRTMSLTSFVEGNISRRGVRRGEIGFLKPVIRRAFLEAHALRYKEEMRLGEDYDLYVRAMVRGARYKVIEHCGYGAVVRQDSLSGRHRTEDLRMLYLADEAVLADPILPASARPVVLRHRDHVRGKYELRAFLDVKSQRGKLAALRHLFGRPGVIPTIAAGIALDKLELLRGTAAPASEPRQMRYLLPGVPAAQK